MGSRWSDREGVPPNPATAQRLRQSTSGWTPLPGAAALGALAAVLVLASPLTIAATPAAPRIWTAPYTGFVDHGAANSRHYGCGGSDGGDLKFSLTTGDLTSTHIYAIADACTGGNTGSSALRRGLEGYETNSFTPGGGSHTVTVTWSFDYNATLDLHGVCAGASGYVQVIYQAGYINNSATGTGIFNLIAKRALTYISGSGHASYHSHQLVQTLKATHTATFGSHLTYEMFTDISFEVWAATPNLSLINPIGCDVTSSVRVPGGGPFASLLEVKVS